jgi:NAD(P)-dependent dehydrogenase (short-subunit alcohol dehydrogenase family)
MTPLTLIEQNAAEETAKITGGSLDVLINNAGHQDPKHTFHNIVQL